MIRPYYNLDDPVERGPYYGGPRVRIGSPLLPAVKWIIISCIAVFLLQFILNSQSADAYKRFMTLFSYTPALAFGKGYIWQVVTYVFLHGGLFHILFNLFFLWMIGGLVEGRLGTKRFLWLFFIAGASGALAQGVVFPSLATIGASAAVLGVAAACGMLFPNMMILVFFIFPMKMKHFVILLAVIDIVSAAEGGGNVAHYAHLAGLGAGYLFVKFEPRVRPVVVPRWRRLKILFRSLWWRLTGRFRGFTGGGGGESVHIEDDEAYQREVDRLLDKIFREGTSSLTDEENEFLRKTSEKYRK